LPEAFLGEAEVGKWAKVRRRAVTRQDVGETRVGAVHGARRLQETGFVMQRQDQAVDFKGHLVLVGVGAQVAGLLGLHHGAVHGRQPGAHRARERIAHRARPVVEFHGAADVEAARIDFERGALHPVVEQRRQARQAARLLQRREEDLFFKAHVVFADDRDLQLLARAEMGEHAGLAHAHDLGQRAYAQAFQPDLRGQAQGRIHDGRLGLLAFLLAFGHGAARHGAREALAGSSVTGMGATK
jgi:hypothetical protein